MADKIEIQSHREYERVKVRGVAFAALYLNEYMVLGQLLDISQGGLSFKYIRQIYDDFNVKRQDGSDMNMDIFVQDDYEMTVESIQCKVVYDYLQPKEHEYTTLQINKCAVQFQSLSLDQSEKLLQFLGKE